MLLLLFQRSNYRGLLHECELNLSVKIDEL